MAQRVERVEQHCLEEEVHGKRVRRRPRRHGWRCSLLPFHTHPVGRALCGEFDWVIGLPVPAELKASNLDFWGLTDLGSRLSFAFSVSLGVTALTLSPFPHPRVKNESTFPASLVTAP